MATAGKINPGFSFWVYSWSAFWKGSCAVRYLDRVTKNKYPNFELYLYMFVFFDICTFMKSLFDKKKKKKKEKKRLELRYIAKC